MQIARMRFPEISSPESKTIDSTGSEGIVTSPFSECEGNKQNLDQNNEKTHNQINLNCGAWKEKIGPIVTEQKCTPFAKENDLQHIQVGLEQQDNFQSNEQLKTLNQFLMISNQESDSCLNKQQSCSYEINSCFNCDILKLQTKKYCIDKQISLSLKYQSEKEQMKKQFNKKYNQLWQSFNERNKIIMSLELQNEQNQRQIQKLSSSINQQKSLNFKLIQSKTKSFNKELADLTETHQQELQSISIKHRNQIECLKEQVCRLKSANDSLQATIDQTQSKYKTKISQIEEEHIQFIQMIKKNFESKFILAEERNASQMQAFMTQHMIQSEAFLLERESYQEIIKNKDEMINKILLSLQESSKRNTQFYIFEALSQTENSTKLVNEIRNQIQTKMEFYLKNLDHKVQNSLEKSYAKVIALQKQNSILKQKIIKRNNVGRTFFGSQLNSTQQKNLYDISSQQVENTQERKQQLFKKMQECLRNQLQIKQRELSVCQQLITDMQTKLQIHQDQYEQNICEYKRQVKILQQKICKMNAPQEQVSIFYDEMLTEKQEQICHWKGLYQEMQHDNSSTCHAIQCKSNLLEIDSLKTKYDMLKQNYADLQLQYQSKVNEMQLQRQTLVSQIQQTEERRTQKLIEDVRRENGMSLQKTKRSYEKILAFRNQEIEELSQINTELIRFNFQLNRKCHQAQSDMLNLQVQFQELLGVKL